MRKGEIDEKEFTAPTSERGDSISPPLAKGGGNGAADRQRVTSSEQERKYTIKMRK